MTPLQTLRVVSASLAGLLGAAGVWMLATELIAAPSTGGEAGVAATAAATVGVVRGDLWARAGLAQAAPLIGATAGKTAPAARAEASATLQRAGRLSPHDARVWLALAALEADSPSAGGAAEMLKLSYITGASELALVPLRLAVGARLAADADVRSLLELEVQTVVSWHPELRPAVVQAYKTAAPEGREAIETMLRQTEPGLLDSLNDGGAR